MKTEPATLRTSAGTPVVLQGVQASGRLSGLLLQMTLRQRFRNDEAAHIEVSYTFPLPWGAVLTGLEATLGQRRLRGQVLRRREASAQYEDAIAQGDAPVMVERNREGSYTVSLGSLQPGEEATVELGYAQLLTFEQGRVRLVVPTTIAPRYGDPVQDGGLLPHQAAQPDLLAEHAFGLTLHLAGPLAQARLSCPTHRVSQQRTDDGVCIATDGPAWLDRDFVLLMEGLEGQCLAVAGPDPAAGPGHCALIASYCPPLAPRPQAEVRLKILVDCSGSMQGDSMQQARSALLVLAALLQPQDRFSYSRFGSHPQLALHATRATDRGLQRLREAIAHTQADLGGTEMEDAFSHVLGLSFDDEPGGPEADVLVITDGDVWNVQGVLARALDSGHRIYALGVGSAPAESLLNELAQGSGGACELVTPNEDMGAAMTRLLQRLRGTAAVHVGLVGAPEALWCSPLPRRLRPDETVHVGLRLPAAPAAAPGLRVDDQTQTPPALTWLQDDLVARMVAARQIGPTPADADAVAIAERYQLVTDQTNLLLVMARDAERQSDGMPVLRQVRAMVAAGVAGLGRVQERATAGFMASAGLGASVWRMGPGRRKAYPPRAGQLKLGAVSQVSEPMFLRGPGMDQAASRRLIEDQLDAILRNSIVWDAARGLVGRLNQAATPGCTLAEAIEAARRAGGGLRMEGDIEWVADGLLDVDLETALAVLLLVMHLHAIPGARLSDTLLALVMEQAQYIDTAMLAQIQPRFSQAAEELVGPGPV